MHMLHTKLLPPPIHENRVNRAHLLHKLDTALSYQLTLVCAPAGYGKTTLLSQWLQQRQLPAGWVSLDRGDNDPAQFIGYFLAAIQSIDPDAGALIPGMLLPPKPAPVSKILLALVNDLAASPHDFVIVLDDYQEIDAQIVHDFLARLIEHMPGNLHLIIAARADPPLSLPHLRGRGQLLELRAADLSFNTAEASAFFHDAMRLPLSANAVDALLHKAEGWAAGLQIAAIFLQNQTDLPQAVQSFTGGHRHILDYLASEVIERLPAPVQAFLSQTAILDQLQASLCDAVTGRGDSAQILEQLDRENQFIIPLDGEQRWYRYHRLMAEALRRRTALLDQAHLAVLHRRASDWYAAQGMTNSAIQHAFESGDFEHAADLIKSCTEDMLKSSRIVTLLKWLDRLPEDLLRVRPALNLAYAWALLLKGGSTRAVQERLAGLSADLAGTSLSAQETLLRALIAALSGDFEQSLAYSQHALETLPENNLFLRSIAADNLGIAHVLHGDIPSAIQAFKDSSALAKESGNTMFLVASLSNLAGLYLIQGHLQLAGAVYRQALNQATAPSGQRLPVACRALMGLGEIAREWNQLAQARQYLEQAVQLSQQYSEAGELVLRLNLGRVLQAQKEGNQALEMIQRAQALALQSTATKIDDRLVDATLAHVWLQQGNLAGASEWAARCGFEQASPGAALPGDALPMPYDIREAEWMVYARLRLAQQQPQAALLVLAALLIGAQQQGRLRRQHEILLLIALAHQQAASTDEALEYLQRSLELAEPEGCTRVFIEEGAPLTRLLRQAVHRGIHSQFCSQLLNDIQAEQRKPQPASGEEQTGLIEPLSEREFDVLRLLAEGCTNHEISQRLYISLSTVKGHVANLSGKLLARNRTEAVARARQLGLLAND
jgi:LuxR family maltose regulon positive regulatory protein